GADGALVRMTEPGGPAEEAGIEKGAVITRVDDRAVDDSDAVVAALRSSAPGGTESATYAARVGAEPTTVDVQLGEARGAPDSTRGRCRADGDCRRRRTSIRSSTSRRSWSRAPTR